MTGLAIFGICVLVAMLITGIVLLVLHFTIGWPHSKPAPSASSPINGAWDLKFMGFTDPTPLCFDNGHAAAPPGLGQDVADAITVTLNPDGTVSVAGIGRIANLKGAYDAATNTITFADGLVVFQQTSPTCALSSSTATSAPPLYVANGEHLQGVTGTWTTSVCFTNGWSADHKWGLQQSQNHPNQVTVKQPISDRQTAWFGYGQTNDYAAELSGTLSADGSSIALSWPALTLTRSSPAPCPGAPVDVTTTPLDGTWTLSMSFTHGISTDGKHTAVHDTKSGRIYLNATDGGNDPVIGTMDADGAARIFGLTFSKTSSVAPSAWAPLDGTFRVGPTETMCVTNGKVILPFMTQFMWVNPGANKGFVFGIPSAATGPGSTQSLGPVAVNMTISGSRYTYTPSYEPHARTMEFTRLAPSCAAAPQPAPVPGSATLHNAQWSPLCGFAC